MGVVHHVAPPCLVKIRHLKDAGILEDVGVDSLPHEFRKFNVIYGFNGSGKTTLCRLIESISDSGLNENLPEEADFSFELSDGSTPSPSAPANAASRYIAVFSEDFVDRSLRWKAGSADPIIFLGEEQAELGKALEELENTEAELVPQQTQRAGEWSANHRALEAHCTERARSVAEELGLGRRYTARNLKDDYGDSTISPSDKLSEEERAALKEVIWSTDTPSKIASLSFRTRVFELQNDVSSALEITVQRITIEALERRKDALPWVKQGMELHVEEPECLFCGNQLAADRRHELERALSGEFEALADRVDRVIASVRAFQRNCESARDALQSMKDIAPEFRAAADASVAQFRTLVERGVAGAAHWLSLLQNKSRNPAFVSDVGVDLISEDWDNESQGVLTQLNDIIGQHNQAADDFEKTRAKAAARLRRHLIQDTAGVFQSLVASEAAAKQALDSIDEQLTAIRRRMGELRTQLKAHGPAAKQLNTLLKSYLGHGKITLVATDEGYQICRDRLPSTKPLSEGEKTAVAFCYFVTALAAEGRKVEDMIVVIDDPVSSLDTRAMSHVVGMIRLRFGKANQFFVLTHNLDFMREMKKWLNSKLKSGDVTFLFIETRVFDENTRSSKICEMPKLIREYESEYHYLFSLVCMLVSNSENAGGFLYLLPNAMRKVLETFLAFKQPGYAGFEGVDRILAAHQELDADRVKAMELLVQAESHAQNIGDSVSFSAYTLEQIAEAGKTLLALIEAADKPHYERMRQLCGG